MIEATKAVIAPAKTHLALEHEHDRPLTACHWGRTGRSIFFGAEDNLIHRYDLGSGAVTHLAAHDSWVRAMDTSPDGQTLYSGGYDGRLVWWVATADKPEPVRVIDAHQGWIRAIAASPSGQQLATCGNDLLINVWDTAEGGRIHSLAGHASHVYHVAFAPDGNTLVSCDLHGIVKVWDAASGKLQRDLTAAKSLHQYDKAFRADIGGARCIAFRGDGQQLALGGITKVSNAFAGVGRMAVVVLDMTSGEAAVKLEMKAKTRGAAWGIAYHPAGFWLGVSGGSGGGWLCCWEGDKPEEMFSLKLKSDGRGMSLSTDGTQVAVAHADKRLRTYALHEPQA